MRPASGGQADAPESDCGKMTRRFRLASRVRKNNPPPAPNRLQAPFVVQEANRQWVSDLTFIPTRGGFLYLTTVLDLSSRVVVGWAVDLCLARTLVCEALQMAILRRRPKPGTIVHSGEDQSVPIITLNYRLSLRIESQPFLTFQNIALFCGWASGIAERFQLCFGFGRVDQLEVDSSDEETE